jgi:hypothetical protein
MKTQHNTITLKIEGKPVCCKLTKLKRTPSKPAVFGFLNHTSRSYEESILAFINQMTGIPIPDEIKRKADTPTFCRRTSFSYDPGMLMLEQN